MIIFHSFRAGSGRTFLAANVAALLAMRGRRVAIVDANFNRPALHHLLGLEEGETRYSIRDYLRGKCPILPVAADVTGKLPGMLEAPTKMREKGRLYLLPGEMHFGEFSSLMKERWVDFVEGGRQHLIDELSLDVLLVDALDGWNEETLMLVSTSKALVSVLKMDYQDFQFTASFIDSARTLGVPNVIVVASQVPPGQPLEHVEQQIHEGYNTPAAVAIPYSGDVLVEAGRRIFALAHPDHPVTQAIDRLAQMVEGINEKA